MSVRRRRGFHLIALGLASALGGACAESAPPAVVPLPAQMEVGRGTFALDDDTRITLSDPADTELRRLAEVWAQPVRAASGLDLPITDETDDATANLISLRLAEDASTHPEGYRLSVTRESVTLGASTPAGLFYGLQTLTQLVPQGDANDWSLPAVRIVDAPRFAYRGMHLDVGRHFFPVAFIKKYLNLLAMYKINTFHWHLTEDQGWRIEIEKYPRLTTVGAYREETVLEKNVDPYVGDGQSHGGFYTQDEVREVVAYARDRYIVVISEIEMPGHSAAALAAYPELACTDGPFEVPTTWGVKDDIYCPKEETFQFLEDVLTEVMDLFPGTYIHIGGDEVPKTRWEESGVAQDVISREGLADEAQLQSYFIRRIESFVQAHGRRLIGGLSPEQARHILGAQGNVWTEYMATTD